MKFIEIGSYKICVDECDADLIQSHSWSIRLGSKPSFFARVRIGADSTSTSKKMSLARLILGDDTPNTYVIHRPGYSPLDFRKEALMICSMTERQASIRKQKLETSSRYKGVSYSKNSRKWRASIRPNGDSIYLGEFENEADAALAYNKAAVKYFGEHAFVNDIDRDDPPPHSADAL